MDEVLTPGWRKPVEEAFARGIDRLHYRRIEAFNPDGSVASEFNGFKVHRREGIRWHYPIHEVPQWYLERDEVKEFVTGFETHHLQDKEKSRGQYLPMLEMAVRENPDARNLYYLGREQSYHQQYDKSAENLKKYLELSVFPEERSAACRILAKAEPDNAEEWFMKGTEEFASRESILALANYYYTKAMWDECLLVAEKALLFKEKPTQFLAESWAWGHMAYDLAAISCWQLGRWNMAYKYGKEAVKISPNDERLAKNLAFYKEKMNGNSK
jgi:tetratricopeptide (TPR) repeat protein